METAGAAVEETEAAIKAAATAAQRTAAAGGGELVLAPPAPQVLLAMQMMAAEEVGGCGGGWVIDWAALGRPPGPLTCELSAAEWDWERLLVVKLYMRYRGRAHPWHPGPTRVRGGLQPALQSASHKVMLGWFSECLSALLSHAFMWLPTQGPQPLARLPGNM